MTALTALMAPARVRSSNQVDNELLIMVAVAGGHDQLANYDDQEGRRR
jgi:hypothetical protein